MPTTHCFNSANSTFTMNTRIPIIALAICLFAVSAALARNPDPKKADVDCKAYVNQKVRETNDRIDSLKSTSNATGKKAEVLEKRLEELYQTVQKQSETINTLSGQLKEVQGKLQINANEIASLPRDPPPTPLWVKMPLAIIVALILAVLVFAFWPRKTVSPSVSTESSDRPKCPCCGWEHDPKDTVCKNPNCKIQF